MKLIDKDEVDPGMIILAMEEGERAGGKVLHVGRVEARLDEEISVPRLWVTWLLVADRKSDAAWTGPAAVVQAVVVTADEARARARGGHIDRPELSLRGVWLDDLEGDYVRAIGCEAPAAGEGLRGAVERALLIEVGMNLARAQQAAAQSVPLDKARAWQVILEGGR